jgi:hypothetical protein
MPLPKLRNGLSACEFGGVEKRRSSEKSPLIEAVPWHVIDMPWDCNLMLNNNDVDSTSGFQTRINSDRSLS